MRPIPVLAALLFVMSQTAAALPVVHKPPMSLSAGGGLSLPQSSQAVDVVQNGLQLFAGIETNVAPGLTLGPRLAYTSLPADFGAIQLSGIGGGATQIVSLSLESRATIAPPLAPVKPFVMAGFGVANLRQEEVVIPAGLVTSFSSADLVHTQTNMIWSLGAGVSLVSTPVLSFFVQGRIENMLTDGKAFTCLPFSIGVRFF